MAVEMNESLIPDLGKIMPWDRAQFMEIRARFAAEGVEYTVARFQQEFYDTRKNANPSIKTPAP